MDMLAKRYMSTARKGCRCILLRGKSESHQAWWVTSWKTRFLWIQALPFTLFILPSKRLISRRMIVRTNIQHLFFFSKCWKTCRCCGFLSLSSLFSILHSHYDRPNSKDGSAGIYTTSPTCLSQCFTSKTLVGAFHFMVVSTNFWAFKPVHNFCKLFCSSRLHPAVKVD